jgi:hypothetical protein
MTDPIDKYKFAYLNSIAASLNCSKGDAAASLARLVNTGHIRAVTFTNEVKTRGRRPKQVFLPEQKLNRHFDFSSPGLRGGHSIHLLLLLSAAGFLATECGAYVDACQQTAKTDTQGVDAGKRSPDAFALLRNDELHWAVTRPFSIEAETSTSLDNNKWTRQVSVNALKNFLLGYKGNIFVCYSFDAHLIREITSELAPELMRRTFCLKVDADTNVVEWEIPIPITRRKTLDLDALGWE